MEKLQPQFVSLGESAMILQWGNFIDRSINMKVNAMANALRKKPFAGMVDLVPAYCSLTVFYNVPVIKRSLHTCDSITSHIQQHIEKLIQHENIFDEKNKSVIEIPVCYDASLSNDLDDMSVLTRLQVDEIINIHSNAAYYVYMLGFLPGFAYMGEVDERIAVDRKSKPVNVSAGAVGIAGKQTGIYPVDSPGGWQIVGYTPIKMFDPQAATLCLVNAGDKVKFIPINVEEYHGLKTNKQHER
ncbi:5-oxoprolinase subunit B [soil metagenome]